MNANHASTAPRFFTAPARASAPRAPAELRLVGGETFRTHGRTRGLRLAVIEGLLWVTQEGDPADYLLAAGETFASDRSGSVVAQTMTPASRFSFTPARG